MPLQSLEPETFASYDASVKTGRFLFFLAIGFSVFQVFWFGRFCLHQIDYDGISYLGIARHIRTGDFRGSLNAFRSPLFSWLIAVGCLIWNQPIIVGKVLTVSCYLACLPLTWFLTVALWRSRLAAGIACLGFSLARGIGALSVEMVSPDPLLTALVILYFLVLLECIRGNAQHWGVLGLIHAFAFLAKAVALPWLAVITAVVVLMKRRQRARNLVIAFAAPAILACRMPIFEV